MSVENGRFAPLKDRLRPHLKLLYGHRAEAAWESIREVCLRFPKPSSSLDSLWSERDAVLITYADQIRSVDTLPLEALHQFLTDRRLNESFSLLHLLPFFPSTSDDGFSVSDYRIVDPEFGDWSDIARLGVSFDLMFDLVLNHASRRHDWFEAFLRKEAPYDRYFVETFPGADLARVVRPRSLPLLTPCDSPGGRRHVWTTFSDDQMDLNYAEPAVLAEMLDVLLTYVRHGARIIRMDAIAYLWKEIGTSCIHLPQTHAVVKIFRHVTDALAPGSILLTETNVPHRENISYFGSGDEAHLVYNFSLPPLLLDALLHGDGTYLTRWLREFPLPTTGNSWLNFTASHDGIGVRPLEAVVPPERVTRLVQAIESRGGRISTRALDDGTSAPYELNATYFDALGEENLSEAMHVRRFLASQAVMMSLPGIPAVYFQSLLAAPNDHAGVARTGRARSINRRKYTADELDRILEGDAIPTRVWQGLVHLLSIRKNEPSFHPDAAQIVLASDRSAIMMLARIRPRTDCGVVVAVNLSGCPQSLRLPRRQFEIAGPELLGGAPSAYWAANPQLDPYQVAWIPIRGVDRGP